MCVFIFDFSKDEAVFTLIVVIPRLTVDLIFELLHVP